MSAPEWLQQTIAEFGRGAGLQSLALNDRGAASLSFDNGTSLVFEYAFSSLVVMMTVPVSKTPEVAGKVLSFAIPERRTLFRINAGFMPKADKAFFAIRLPREEITLPVLMSAFNEVRHLAGQFAEVSR